MTDTSRTGLIGAALIGLGCGLAAFGAAMVVPACANFSLNLMGQAFQKGRESVESAAASLGELTGRAQHRFQEAAKNAKGTTARAAGAVENAARHVREYAS
jgi:hypothetical protein